MRQWLTGTRGAEVDWERSDLAFVLAFAGFAWGTGARVYSYVFGALGNGTSFFLLCIGAEE